MYIKRKVLGKYIKWKIHGKYIKWEILGKYLKWKIHGKYIRYFKATKQIKTPVFQEAYFIQHNKDVNME